MSAKNTMTLLADEPQPSHQHKNESVRKQQKKNADKGSTIKRFSWTDGLITLGALTVATSSIFRQFSSYHNLGQSKSVISLSLGSGASNTAYFFQVTLWNLWLAVVGYILVYDILINRLIRGKKDLTKTESVINKMLATLAVTVSLVYWCGMGVPKALAGLENPNAFYLLNTFGLHFLIPMMAIAYYYIRSKNSVESDKDPIKVWQYMPYILCCIIFGVGLATEYQALQGNARLAAMISTGAAFLLAIAACYKFRDLITVEKLHKGEVLPTFLCFSAFAAMFVVGSLALQFWIAPGTPVYLVFDWQKGLSIALLGTVALGIGLTFIFYTLYKKQTTVKGKNLTEPLAKGKPMLMATIMAAMSFTVVYTVLAQCAHWNAATMHGWANFSFSSLAVASPIALLFFVSTFLWCLKAKSKIVKKAPTICKYSYAGIGLGTAAITFVISYTSLSYYCFNAQILPSALLSAGISIVIGIAATYILSTFRPHDVFKETFPSFKPNDEGVKCAIDDDGRSFAIK